MSQRDRIVVVGYSKTPSSSASHSSNDYLAVCLLVNDRTHEVLEVDSTAVTGLVRRWIADLLIGLDLSTNIQPTLEIVDRTYLGVAVGSIRQAIKDASRRYAAFQNEDASPGGTQHSP